MIKILTSRSGRIYSVLGNRQLNSAYDPEKEAIRFLDRQMGTKNPSTVILLGPALGYLNREIKKRLPEVKLISVFYSKLFYRYSGFYDDYYWYPGIGENLSSFFFRTIEETDLSDLMVIEWPPSAAALPEISHKANQTLQGVLEEYNGNLLTTSVFGKKWIKNTFFNFLFTGSFLAPEHVSFSKHNFSVPILVAASGVSLLKTLKLIESLKDNLFLIALPSSLRALLSEGLQPDLVITTDAGYYASYHLQVLKGKANIPVAMPFSAARGIWRTENPVFLLSQSTFFEETIIKTSGLEALRLPANGTVSGTALEFSLAISENPIILAGLDLCWDDIVSHISPNSFELLLREREYKTAPAYTKMFERALSFAPYRENLNSPDSDKIIRLSRTLRTYAEWFCRKSLTLPAGRVFRLEPSAVQLEGIKNITGDELFSMCRRNGGFKKPELHNDIRQNSPPLSVRRDVSLKILSFWLDRLEAVSGKIERDNSLDTFTSDPLVMSILYYIELSMFLKLKKSFTIDLARNLIERARSFLETLLTKIETI